MAIASIPGDEPNPGSHYSLLAFYSSDPATWTVRMLFFKARSLPVYDYYVQNKGDPFQ
jgi:hypothetical protein